MQSSDGLESLILEDSVGVILTTEIIERCLQSLRKSEEQPPTWVGLQKDYDVLMDMLSGIEEAIV